MLRVPAQARAELVDGLCKPPLGDVEARQVSVAERSGRVTLDSLLHRRASASDRGGVLRGEALPPRLRAGFERVERLPAPHRRRFLSAGWRTQAQGLRKRPIGSVPLHPRLLSVQAALQRVTHYLRRWRGS